ncbi:MAG: penicillin-binding protein activator [Fibromonadaceae bacterium]|jgi:ABC-type branched-subunit amino acid transport system substrate-binding protein|nr:penicillin-binding protein activator [Fibromonadaceae bacterium]
MRFILLLLLLFSFGWTASYNEIVKKIQAGDFAGANSGLETMVKSRWRTGEQERAVVLYVENSIRLGKLSDARRYATQFLDFFPKSRYRARVETSLAVLNILEKDPYAGAEMLRRVLAYTKNPVAAARARDLLSQIFSADLLSINELQNMLEKGIEEKQTRGLAQLALGQRMQRENRYKAATYWYGEAKKNNPALEERVDKLRSALEGRSAGHPVILILAPLSGPHAELGNYMVQGALLYSDNLKNKARLQIMDDRADPVTALRKVKQALIQDSVVAVIGPLLSASAATVAAWMSERAPQIPLITPTATDDGIAEMGRNIFQLNVSSARLASAIADYAMNCLQINEFAIMSPFGDYGSLMSDEFQRAIERRGGMILATQNYVEGLPDYQNEFKLLRDRKLTLDTRRMNMSRGNTNVSAIIRRDSWLRDSTLAFPAMFIPSTNPADAGSMASQVSFNKLRAGALLGSSGWYGREFLLNAKNQAEGSVFSVAFYNEGENLKAFSERFKSRWEKEPDKSRVAGLSYDAIRIITAVLPNSGSLPAAILQKKEFDGVYGKIIFSRNGANESVGLIAVEQGKFTEKSPSCEETPAQ